MKVSELIKELEKYNGEAEIFIGMRDCSGKHYPIANIFQSITADSKIPSFPVIEFDQQND